MEKNSDRQWQSGGRNVTDRLRVREGEGDRQRQTEGEIDELREDAESVPLSRLLPEANRQPLCWWNANATSCSSLVFPPFFTFLLL